MIKIIIILLFFLFPTESFSQITGLVKDSTNMQPIEHALIGLVEKANPTDTAYYFCDNKGAFSIASIPTGNFTLIFSSLGFRAVVKFVPVEKPLKLIAIENVVLVPLGTLLNEVTIQAAPITIKEDTIEYRADAFAVKENATTEDLLKKLPGISVDKDGNVTAQGKSVTRIRVNGKDFFGGDVKSATKELPANIIEKVQVIDDYGDQANVSGIKDGTPDKIINLQIKKDKSKGIFGRATAGIGTQDRYLASLNSNYFNNTQQISLFANSNNTNQSLFNFSGGGNVGMGSMMKMGQRMMGDMGGGSGMMNAFQNGDQAFVSGNNGNNNGITTSNSVGVNYRDQWGKKINVYGSYTFGYRSNEALQAISSQNFFQQNSFINNQNNTTTSKGNNHRVFFNMEYQIDSFNYLKISPGFTYSNSNDNNVSIFDYLQTGGPKTSDGSNENLSKSSVPNINATILYNHRFRKKGRNLSANLSLGSNDNNSSQDVSNITNSYALPAGIFSQYQYINQVNNNYNYGIRLTYSEPLSKTRNLDIAASHNLNHAANNRTTYNTDPINGSSSIFLPDLSNHFENNFYNNRVGVSVRTVLKKLNYTVGLSMQPVSLQGRSVTKDSAYKVINRINVFPIARFAYNFSKTKTINANYSGNATQPTFAQLQDVLDISNQQAVTRGNPFLKPSINHNVNLSFNNFNIVTGRIMFTNITISTIQNQIVNNVIRRGNTGAQLSMPDNVNGYFNVLGFYTYSRPYNKRKYILTLNGNANYNNNINLVDSIRNIGKNWIVSQGFVLEYNYKTWLTLGTGASYSLNDVKYKKPAGSLLSALQNTNSSALTLSSNIDIDIKQKWILKYNFDYTFNYGLNATVTQNIAILNASLERQLFKKKHLVIKLAAFDLFNQNTNISRSVLANSIVDSRSNRLARYFLLSITYRLQKFQGQKPKAPGFGDFRKENRNAELKVF